MYILIYVTIILMIFEVLVDYKLQNTGTASVCSELYPQDSARQLPCKKRSALKGWVGGWVS